jgi:2-keto-4-pentenoate hydratase/2-oxohepta-3-ene-1,7-dioic acid hydratase in catechol pathway
MSKTTTRRFLQTLAGQGFLGRRHRPGARRDQPPHRRGRTAMLIAQTSLGPARRTAGGYQLLGTGASLERLIRDEQLTAVCDAPVRETVPLDAVVVLPPVRRPGKVCIVGLNYSDHAREIGAEPPAAPRFSWGAGSAVAGPYDDIVLPGVAPGEVDYEGELALVIGARAERVAEQHAWRCVAGVTAANDVSARDVQLGRGPRATGPNNIGVAKSFDTFKPLGPALLTADELDPGTPLRIETRVDGEVRQSSTTANLIFGIERLVSAISHYATLEPGDVILTGTPGGVALITGRYLTDGQVVEVELERVGTLRNRVVRQFAPTR